jgi:phenylacetate-CoA ligase
VGVVAKLIASAPRYAALLRSQYWPAHRLEAYREQHLNRTLSAAIKIPFYAERLGAAPRAEDLERLPILKRAEVELLNRSVRSLYPPDTPYFRARSSGTSGVAVEVFFDRSHQSGRYAARVRYLTTYGWNPVQRSAWSTSARFISGARGYHPDSQFVNPIFFGVKFISNAMPFGEQVAILTRFRPRFIYGCPSDLDGMLRVLEDTGQDLPSLRQVFSGGEVVDESLRDRMRRKLGLEMHDNYGTTEAFLAWQCPQGNYHINAEHVVLEVVDESGRQVAAGQMGKVLVTTLENYLMPLIRYEIGDYATAVSGSCPCGRSLPLLGPVLGRELNLFRTPAGRLFSTWDLVNSLRVVPEIGQFQIVQKSFDQISVRYVSRQPLAVETEARIRTAFHDYLGNHTAIGLERVSEIARASSGKFMLTLSQVPP